MSNKQQYVVMIECGSQKLYTVPLDAVHHFDKKKHDQFKSYKFDLLDSVLYGTVSFIGSSLEEVQEILNKNKRLSKPNEKFIIPAVETTDTENEVQKDSKNDEQKKIRLRVA
ncbi:uncharacterized protein LOC127278488 [Leptopilina boulardi]|uniref:uncharacterized protein LOC127278488 n=1 Tax=Leptopilina boulardi TaxID=63433 RepID=UPI0021F5C568|nr:uncharacterized protein LOC127278488 [Leptopilina boulardi]